MNPISEIRSTSRQLPKKDDVRGPFLRDYTAIIHCLDFRRLKSKTQVFFAPTNDHICTRIEHVIHVSTIATTICKGLKLNTEMTQAIAIGHDIGHTPFGHSGEKTLDKIMKLHGESFNHELHGLRVVDKIADRGNGLNLTLAVRDGIATHNGEKFEQTISPTLESADPETYSSLNQTWISSSSSWPQDREPA